MYFPGDSWEAVDVPDRAGVSSACIADALERIVSSRKDIHSMLIVKGGELVFEKYFPPYTPNTLHSQFSCSKTFTSMLIGIAGSRGIVSEADRVLGFFPDVEVNEVSQNLRDMTVRDLLVMGTGHAEDTLPALLAEPSGDFASAFLNAPVPHRPGTHFVYNTGATYMLSAILTRATGRSALDLANEWMFDKIGIRGVRWDACPRGVSMGGTGLYLTPRQMARFGLLILNKGKWRGEQLIPADYIERATTKQIDNLVRSNHTNPNWRVGYCYQIWRNSFAGSFRADGMGGQFIVMLPDQEMVVVFTSALGEDIYYPLEIVEQALLPGVGATAGEEGAARLTSICAAIDSPDVISADLVDYPWGSELRAAEDAPIESIRMLSRDRIYLRSKHLGEVELSVGWGVPALNHVSMSSPLKRVMPVDEGTVAVTLTPGNGLDVKVALVGYPSTYRLSTRVEGGVLKGELAASSGEVFEMWSES